MFLKAHMHMIALRLYGSSGADKVICNIGGLSLRKKSLLSCTPQTVSFNKRGAITFVIYCISFS